jgi:hypothetical protein
MNKLVASMWLGSAVVFCAGVLVLAQYDLNGSDSSPDTGMALRNHERVQQVIREDKRMAKASDSVQQAESGPEIQGPTAEAVNPPQPKPPLAVVDPAMQPPPPPSPDQLQGWVSVTGQDAVMRPRPSMSSPVMFAFPIGRKLGVVQSSDGWTEAVDPTSHATGWIASDQLSQPGQAMAAADYSQGGNGYDGSGDDMAMPSWQRQGKRGRRDGPIAGFFRRAFGQ